MFCTKCGSLIPDGTGFCPSCGAAAGSEAAPSGQQPQQDQAQTAGQWQQPQQSQPQTSGQWQQPNQGQYTAAPNAGQWQPPQQGQPQMSGQWQQPAGAVYQMPVQRSVSIDPQNKKLLVILAAVALSCTGLSALYTVATNLLSYLEYLGFSSVVLALLSDLFGSLVSVGMAVLFFLFIRTIDTKNPVRTGIPLAVTTGYAFLSLIVRVLRYPSLSLTVGFFFNFLALLLTAGFCVVYFLAMSRKFSKPSTGYILTFSMGGATVLFKLIAIMANVFASGYGPGYMLFYMAGVFLGLVALIITILTMCLAVWYTSDRKNGYGFA